MAKLWQKGYDVDALIEEFTVGQDWVLDAEILPADCLGSMAQAQVLRSAGLLTEEEQLTLHRALVEAFELAMERRLPIRPQDEDAHTVLEAFLTQRCGEAGKKIHTGRSRNDQVITALRLWGRHQLLYLELQLLDLVEALLRFAQEHERVPMPGRTHLQAAMPSSVGLWAGAWAEELLEWSSLVTLAREFMDQGPLGSAASYGSSLPLDRDLASRLLGFARTQNNVLAVHNARGRYESVALDAAEQVGLTLSRWAEDLILFSLPEFGYFELPDRLCSGSSLMPQKKNPDGLELLRSRSAVLSGWATTVKAVVRSLPSGYNRDLQDTKEPFLRGLPLARAMVTVARHTVAHLKVRPKQLRAAFTPEIFATDAVLELVQRGVAFRDAYRQVGTNLQALAQRDPDQALAARTLRGGPTRLGLEETLAVCAERRQRAQRRIDEVRRALGALAGREIEDLTPKRVARAEGIC